MTHHNPTTTSVATTPEGRHSSTNLAENRGEVLHEPGHVNRGAPSGRRARCSLVWSTGAARTPSNVVLRGSIAYGMPGTLAIMGTTWARPGGSRCSVRAFGQDDED